MSRGIVKSTSRAVFPLAVGPGPSGNMTLILLRSSKRELAGWLLMALMTLLELLVKPFPTTRPDCGFVETSLNLAVKGMEVPLSAGEEDSSISFYLKELDSQARTRVLFVVVGRRSCQLGIVFGAGNLRCNLVLLQEFRDSLEGDFRPEAKIRTRDYQEIMMEN